MAKYRILSFDGGGIRGLLTTRILRRLCSTPGLENAFENVNLIAGTSSGGLIALGLAHGLGRPTVVDAIGVMEQIFEHGADTFGPRRLFGPLFTAKYGTESRERAFKAAVGVSTTLGSLRRNVLVPAFDLDNQSIRDDEPDSRKWKPKVFHNFNGEFGDREELVWKVALYTTALPAYFPSVDGFVDGGVFANNPSMCALAQVFDPRYEPSPKPAMDDILMLSFGAGLNLEYMPCFVYKWGGIRWFTKYVGAAVDSTVGIADYQCRQILGAHRYHRIAPEFTPDMYVAPDDLKAIDTLKAFADDIRLESHIQWLKEHWVGQDAPAIVPRRRPTTSKHVLSTTELTCLAPIREGFVGSLDTRTFATRLRIVLRVLHAVRVASREARAVKGVLDVVDAIRGIQAFQFAILNERQLLLTVSFSAAWEPYMRIVWRDLGPLMDLVLCNCKGYTESSAEKGFERFATYIRQVQVESDFFYTSSGLSVDDHRYLEKLERQGRTLDPRSLDERAATLVVDDPLEQLAETIRKDPQETHAQARALLLVLFGLRDLYPDAGGDGAVLARATRALLRGSALNQQLAALKSAGGAVDPEVVWFAGLLEQESAEAAFARQAPAGAGRQRQREDVIQGGILRPYKRSIGGEGLTVTHGCLLLARVTDPGEARRFLRHWTEESLTPEGPPGQRERDSKLRVNRNIAFTFNGLRQLGVPEGQLALLPKEFQEGMEARAGLLGDVRSNHPEAWVLPEWNVDTSTQKTLHERPRVRMSTVDVVVQFTVVKPDGYDDWDRHPLRKEVEDFIASAGRTGITVMSRQLMRNHLDPVSGRPRDHFGFIEGISQPRPDADDRDRDRVRMGEILLGYENDRGDPAFPLADGSPAGLPTLAVRGSLLDNGTFLVIRRLEQHVDRVASIDPQVLEKMMGRQRDGHPLAKTASDGDQNAFDYSDDPEGRLCPLHAHIRRANPRPTPPGKGPVPRILRRGMSYGPKAPEWNTSVSQTTDGIATDTPSSSEAERGLMFMAFNASIAEQYEVIQRWITGGNSTGVFSGIRDPIAGVPDATDPATFRYLEGHTGGPQVQLATVPHEPLVTLRWGTYLFVPSFAAMRQITADPVVDPRRLVSEQIAAGATVMARLQTAEDWAGVYEDVSAINGGITDAVSAAVRSRHGGVRRTPYGVLVASERLVMEVLGDDSVFSVAEYRKRMEQSIGQIYLGLDKGDKYDDLSRRPNAAIERIRGEAAFQEARQQTESALKAMVDKAPAPATFSLEKLADRVLARLSKHWFGIPDGPNVREGGRPTPGDTAPRCPFHTFAPSRFIFSSPVPRPAVVASGSKLGRELLEGVKQFVAQHKDKQSRGDLTAPLSSALFETMGDDRDALAANLVGLLEGFLPTVYGNFLKTMNLWIGDESLWRLQQDLYERGGAGYLQARQVLERPLQIAMMKRPVPDLLYRTATKDVVLGGVRVRSGERVVLSIAAATNELLLQGRISTAPIFGGYRNSAGHPTHACPGHEMAMGVMLGMVAAVLQSGTLSPAPHPFLKLGNPTPLRVKDSKPEAAAI